MTWQKALKIAAFWIARMIGLCWAARLITRRGILIIGWHGVTLSDEHARFPSSFITPDTLRRRLTFLTRHYTVIGLEEAVRQQREGKIRPGQVVLTFDDGYYNFLASAIPVLKEYNATATVYVVSHHMASQDPSWNMILRDMILSTRVTHLETHIGGIDGSYSLRTAEGKESLTTKCLHHLSGLPLAGLVRRSFAQALAAELRIDLDDLLQRRVWHSLSAHEVREVVNAGFSVQLHTHTHPNVVARIEDLGEEITTCRQLIEAATGQKARHFCYPHGYWNEEVARSLDKLGISSGTTARMGPNFVNTPALALRRLLDGESRSQLEFECECSGLRFLIHALLHPSRWYAPSPKVQRYKQEGLLF